MSALVGSPQAEMAPKLRRLTKARRREIQRLRVHLRAKHHLHRLGPSTPFTVYAFTIEDPASQQQRQQQQDSRRRPSWVLEKRFSDFYELRLKLLGLFRLWMCAHDAAHWKKSDEFAFVAGVLRRPLELRLPRRHLRCDSDAIVRERCVGLYDFVRCLLSVYADIYALLFEEKTTLLDRRASAACEVLWGFYVTIAAFLNVPEHRREAEYRHATAVLALEDCNATRVRDRVAACTGGEDYACCICFDDGDVTWDEDDARSSNNNRGGGGGGGVVGEENRRKHQTLVRLPCCHEFHEDCIIQWLCSSATCPLCRQSMAPQ